MKVSFTGMEAPHQLDPLHPRQSLNLLRRVFRWIAFIGEGLAIALATLPRLPMHADADRYCSR